MQVKLQAGLEGAALGLAWVFEYIYIPPFIKY